MSQSAKRLSGWTAFTLERQQPQGRGTKIDGDPFPPLLSSSRKAGPSESLLSGKPLARPFSSVLQPCAENGWNTVSGNCASGVAFIATNDKIDSANSLKELHSWADESLIKDILSAVENDEDQASSLLKAMSFSEIIGPGKRLPESSLSVNDHFFHEGFEKDGSFNEDNLLISGTQENVLPGNMLIVPVQPEWEEDDVYLKHRKEGLHTRRLASKHSRAASNAYMKRDHFSAHQFSKKAQELWATSDKLNTIAAQEILLDRNKVSEPGKLDHHGLHASEVPSALKEFFHEIEVEQPSRQSNKLVYDAVGSSSSTFYTIHSRSKEAAGDKPLLFRRPRTVEIIAGSGTHSKGEAALPSAVRTFLIDNGYRFDEPRAGVFVVRPKFRYE